MLESYPVSAMVTQPVGASVRIPYHPHSISYTQIHSTGPHSISLGPPQMELMLNPSPRQLSLCLESLQITQTLAWHRE